MTPNRAAREGYRGWADRVAEQLGRSTEEFKYANLAIRGRLLGQILGEQLESALDLNPDQAVGRMTAAGANVLLLNGPDIRDTPVLGMVRWRVAIYNENLRTIAARHDAIIGDMWSLRQLSDTQMWDADRLHFSPLGHHTIAIVVLAALNVSHTLLPKVPVFIAAAQLAGSQD